MMKKLLPVILALLGLAVGAGAGFALRPAPPPMPEAEAMGADGHAAEGGEAHAMADPAADPPPPDPDEMREYVRMSDQFLVPLVMEDRVGALIVISLSIETDPGVSEEVFKHEPKLRDEFLKVLFRHAQSGAFNGVFTAGQVMRDLRGSLRQAAKAVLGPVAHDVLVTDIIRQDL